MWNRTVNALMLGAMLLLGAGIGRASVTACATAPNGNTFASYGASDPANGCSEIDKTFTSLTAVSGPVLATDLQLWATGSPPVGNSISPVDVNFDTTGSTDTWQVEGVATQNSSFSYVVDANTGGSFPSPTTGIWAINGIEFAPTGTFAGGAAAGTETVTMTFCLGSATTAGCSAANTGTITAKFSSSTPNYTCTVGAAGTCASPTGNAVNNFAFTEVAVLDSVSLSQTNPDVGQSFTLDNIGNHWEEFATPEPSTFLLIGTALAGVGFLRRRKSKRSI